MIDWEVAMTGKIIKASMMALMTIFVLSSPADSQTLQHIANFSTSAGELQFLPGGYVFKRDDGGTERYMYKDSGFEPLQGNIPALVRNWGAFDWTNVDYLDEIDRHSFDPDVRALLPEHAKVKKILEITLDDRKGTLAVVCFTLRSMERFSRPDATDIFMAGMLNTEPPDRLPKYRKTWTLKAETESDYGDLQYQNVFGAGGFLILYSAAKGGDSVDQSLDVYRISQDVKTSVKNRVAH
jgi:hypothetical protein